MKTIQLIHAGVRGISGKHYRLAEVTTVIRNVASKEEALEPEPMKAEFFGQSMPKRE